jgi:hypothetical protein
VILNKRWMLKLDTCLAQVTSEGEMVIDQDHQIQIVGLDPAQVTKHRTSYYCVAKTGIMERREEWVLESSYPFGVVTRLLEEGQEKHRRLHVARQIHKGELGRYPDVPKPWQDQGEDGWIRLKSVAECAKIEAFALMRGYYAFIVRNSSYALLMAASSEESLRTGTGWRQRMEFGLSWWRLLAPLEELWLGKNDARTLLTLAHFGVPLDDVPPPPPPAD